ncbi:MAG: DUF2163 domain-containing protein [Sphingomonadales bacterium]|jgi:uncharacterized phage protein (TIGR02218 family)
MLNFPQEFADRLNAEVTRLAMCWRVERLDGVALGFTTHDVAFTLDGLLYRPSPSFQPTQVDSKSGFSVDTLEVAGVLSGAALRSLDLEIGRYDDARIDVFIVDWSSPESAQIPLRSGRLGDVRRIDQVFSAELRGRKQDLQRAVGGVFSPECRTDLGDRKCRVSLRDVTFQGTVTAVINNARFGISVVQSNDYFHYGRLRFLSGQNAGLSREVKSDQSQEITVFDPFPFAISVGDLIEVHAGCDKRFVTCQTKFSNVENFRGEPHLPGVDSILDYPGLPS